MLIRAKAPLRLSFGGGGTDVAPFPAAEGGSVLSATINRYAYGSLRTRDDDTIKIRSLDFGVTVSYSRDDKVAYDGKLDLVKAAIAHVGIPQQGFDLFLHTDAPPGSGLGSSSALMVALVALLNDWHRLNLTEYQVADLAVRLEREELRVILLNTKNAVLKVVTVYAGNVSASLVRVGELYRDAIRESAAGVILVHNHPSGDPTPSPDDLHLTAEALAAGRLLDIELLDHLVIGADAYVSLRDRGVAFDRPGGRPRAAAAGDGRLRAPRRPKRRNRGPRSCGGIVSPPRMRAPGFWPLAA